VRNILETCVLTIILHKINVHDKKRSKMGGGGEDMKREKARIAPLVALIIGLVATVVVGGVGVAVSIRVSNNTTSMVEKLPFNTNNKTNEIKVKADKGKLYYALENTTNKRNGYKINAKKKSSASYTRYYSGYISSGRMVGFNYAFASSGWTNYIFKVAQTNNLSSKTTHANLYVRVK
jgi:hypothetical protein